MPAAISRPCRRCGESRTPMEFRDPGDRRGRPPLVCYSCRQQDPKLRARHEAYRDGHAAKREYHHALAARPADVVEAARNALHPTGLKTCLGGAGCGRALPFSAFSPNCTQRDGLRPVCRECDAEHGLAWAIRRAA